MALYEAVFIARQDLTAENVDSLSDKLSQIIIDKGGKVPSKEYWGVRNLAYKINKSSRGHYVSLNVESENEGIEEFKRVVGLNEDIVRSNIFKVENHAKDPSELKVSDDAKSYKPSEARKDDKKKKPARTGIGAEIDKIVINT